jgi:hypothetical protein
MEEEFNGEFFVGTKKGRAPRFVWCVSSSGKLLGITYVPEQQVGPWHQHDTQDGVFAHDTHEEALAEARRLAAANPGRKFIVQQFLEKVSAPVA